MAVSPDGAWLAVCCNVIHCIQVYATAPPHALLSQRVANCHGDFCFTPTCNLLVCDIDNHRLQELTIDGHNVRSLNVAYPYRLALRDDMLAVGSGKIYIGDCCVRLFRYPSGEPLSEFSPSYIIGMRFTLDKRFLIVAEVAYCRHVSVFTLDGEFVRHIGKGRLSDGLKDIEFDDLVLNNMATSDIEIDVNGDIILADFNNNRMCVFPFDGGAMRKAWGNGEFMYPHALAVAGGRLYVLGAGSNNRVCVFE